MPYAPSHTTSACDLSVDLSLSCLLLPCLTSSFSRFWKNLCKNYIHCLRMGRKTESVRERKQGWGGGRGGWSSNQQLTGVRMFMGRVSLSNWSSVSSAVALNTHSLWYWNYSERKNSVHNSFLALRGILYRRKYLFTPKSNDSLYSYSQNCSSF